MGNLLTHGQTSGLTDSQCVHNPKFYVPWFCFGKNGNGIYTRVHGKSWKKVRDKLRRFTSRSRCGSIIQTLESLKNYMRGWLNYDGIADMKNNIESLNGWLYRRIRVCIWKQWNLPRTRRRKLIALGVNSRYAATIAYDRKGYWFNAVK